MIVVLYKQLYVLRVQTNIINQLNYITMKTIIKRVDYIYSDLAVAIAEQSNGGHPMSAIERSFVKDYKGMEVTKVVLKTKNAWGKTIQKTYYCRLV